jgi:adenylate cyclase
VPKRCRIRKPRCSKNMQAYGTIDEFIGDAIFVLFGAPTWREDDAQRAVACAVAMQLAMEDVNEQNRKDDLPEVEMGIGLPGTCEG